MDFELPETARMIRDTVAQSTRRELIPNEPVVVRREADQLAARLGARPRRRKPAPGFVGLALLVEPVGKHLAGAGLPFHHRPEKALALAHPRLVLGVQVETNAGRLAG